MKFQEYLDEQLKNRAFRLEYEVLDKLDEFGKLVAKIRSDRGLSRRELSELSRVSDSTIYRIENGLMPDIRFSTLSKLASVLCIEICFNGPNNGKFTNGTGLFIKLDE